MVINQWVPAAHRGDAVGDGARHTRSILRKLGHDSELFALTMDDDLRENVLPFSDPRAHAGDLTIFHYALPSPMTEAVTKLRGARVVQYHNVTPARFFAPYDPNLFRLATLGRRELATLVGRVDLALGVSDFNRRELESLGFNPTGVLPLAIDLRRLTEAPRVPSLDKILYDGQTNFLFVGRIAPNKKIEDLIRLAEHYKRYVDAYYRFIFVGKDDAVPRYSAMVRALIAEFDMLPERFIFTGPVPDAELAAYYRAASVYLSMSEHEGFCAPLIEAMATDVPVLAYASTAIPDTLGGAGVLFSTKDFESVAELMNVLAFDDEVRKQVIDGQRKRVAAFGEDRVEAELARLVATFSSR